jgi:Tfp pilus assembly protein PilF
VSLAALRPDEEARALIERACAADPHSGFPRSSLAAWHERKGDAEGALREYRAAVATEPSHATGHAGIARILTGRGDLEGAASAYDRALSADPDDVASLVGSAEVRDKKGDAKTAALHLERALVHVPGRADLWLRLAGHYETLGRLENAVAALWEARAIDPQANPIGPRLRALYEKLAEKERR